MALSERARTYMTRFGHGAKKKRLWSAAGFDWNLHSAYAGGPSPTHPRHSLARQDPDRFRRSRIGQVTLNIDGPTSQWKKLPATRGHFSAAISSTVHQLLSNLCSDLILSSLAISALKQVPARHRPVCGRVNRDEIGHRFRDRSTESKFDETS